MQCGVSRVSPLSCWLGSQCARLWHGDFKLALTKKSRPCRGTFAQANQGDRCMSLLHCAHRSTPWLLDTRGCDRKHWVLFFAWALRDTSGRYMVDCTRAIFLQSVRTAAMYFAISLLCPSGEKKQTFSVVSLQLTVQLPCLNVFSSFIFPLRACQKRSFDDVSTVGAGAERFVNTRQAVRSPQSLRSTKIRAWLPELTARPEMSCGVLATLVVWTARVGRSMELSIGCVRRLTGAFAARTRKVEFFLSNHRQFRSNFAWARSWAWPSRCTIDFSRKRTQTCKNWRFLPTAEITQNWHRKWSMSRDGSSNCSVTMRPSSIDNLSR